MTPLVHLRKLNQKPLSCGPIPARGSYYHLEAMPRTGGSAITLVSERHCAEKLLRRLGRDPLPVFDPIAQSLANAGAAPVSRLRMSALNADLFDAIHMLCIVRGAVPRNGVTRTLAALRRNPDALVQRHEIVRFAQALENGGQSLMQAIDLLRKSNPRLREFTFDFLRARMIREGLPIYL
ncbi:hypothetical protein [Paraburkholderia nodosa]|uniref:hypothetical protein n=1 Tax=Paraburkholderia nodosa TaxID=392320 RepID=UPI001377BEF6|nr:hypothetical protein [Paraburkholderia nodosa]